MPIAAKGQARQQSADGEQLYSASPIFPGFSLSLSPSPFYYNCYYILFQLLNCSYPSHDFYLFFPPPNCPSQPTGCVWGVVVKCQLGLNHTTYPVLCSGPKGRHIIRAVQGFTLPADCSQKLEAPECVVSLLPCVLCSRLAPVALCLQPLPVTVVRVSVPQVVPSRINKGIHGIDFSPCCCLAPEQEGRKASFR